MDGYAVAQDDRSSVAIDTELDDELLREGRVRELVHRVNAMRREAGLELTDRIVLTLGPDEAELVGHADWITQETLAVELVTGDVLAVTRA
jgi:isoleucyl-tRNA synthetase